MAFDSIRSVREELPAHGEWIRRLARSLTRDEASADDLAQDTALAALRKGPSESSALAPWLARVTRNFARRGWRDAARRTQRERAVARPEGLPGADEAAHRLETQRLLVEELAALDAPVRHALVRRYLDGWSAARIARETGEPASTVRWRLQRGLAEMRLRLDRRGGRDGVSWRLALAPLCAPSGGWQFLPRVHAPAGVSTAQSVATIAGGFVMKVVSQWAVAAGLFVAIGLGVWWGVERTVSAPPSGSTQAAPLARSLSVPASELAAVPTADRVRETVAGTPAAEQVQEPAAAAVLLRFDGRCLDERLVPIAGARVGLAQDPGSAGAVTAADGTFTLVCDPPAARRECDFVFEAERFATTWVNAAFVADRTTHLGDVILKPGGVVRGRVVGRNQAPFAGARLSITSPELWISLDEAGVRGPGERLAVEGVSGADGRFLIPGVALGPMRAWAGAEGMRWAVSPPVEVRADGESDEIELVLEPVHGDDRITGRVLSPAGEPIPRAGISVMERSGVGMTTMGTQSDDDGRFELASKLGHVYDLSAGDPQDRWASVGLDGVQPGTRDVELRFTEAHWIEVTVRSGSAEVAEFQLSALSLSGGDWLTSAKSESHPGGRAQLRVPNQPFDIQVDARGYAIAQQGPFQPERAPGSLLFELVPQIGVRGRVTSAGQPLAGARVGLYRADLSARIEHQGYLSLVNPRPDDEVVSDAGGRFTLRLRASGTYIVRANAEMHAAGDLGPFVLDPGTGRGELELELGRGGAIEGRVLMPPGRDPAGVIVAVNRGDAHPFTIRSDEQGRFRFDGLTPGPWELSRGKYEVNPKGGGTAYGSASEPSRIPFNCTVYEGRATHADLDLRHWLPCQLTGHLLVNGAPAANWGVVAWPGGSESTAFGSPPSTAVASNGSFALEISEAGPVRLALSPPPESGARGAINWETEVHTGPNTWSQDLAVGRVTGTSASVATPGEESVFYVQSDGPISCFLPIQPDESGRFVLPFVPAGKGAIRRLEESAGKASWKKLVELDVPAGGERIAELP